MGIENDQPGHKKTPSKQLGVRVYSQSLEGRETETLWSKGATPQEATDRFSGNLQLN